MPVTEIGDPRLQALFGTSDPREAAGVRPVVHLPRSGLPPAAFVAVLLMAALLLFWVLNERRTAAPGVPAEEAAATQFTQPPPLYVPPAPSPILVPAPTGQSKPVVITPPIPLSTPAPRIPEPQPAYVPPVMTQMAPSIQPAPRTSAGAPLVIDSGLAAEAGSAAASRSAPTASVTSGVSRMRASALANRSMTVPQGFLIPAVLETAFNSTQPGFARALVSRDVRGFDGKNVLIPRGSRLIGEYRADVAQGQKRATIIWTRLMRPDGMTITMESPAVDPLGRGGVPASVNTHFFGRLGDALLQSTFEVGRTLAGRALTGPVVVLPSSTTATAAGQSLPSSNYVPTLSVPAGKSISVFVAHDLDFTAAGQAR